MDNGVSIRPVQPSSTTPLRTEYATQRQTVRTELPEVAAVTPPASVQDTRQKDPQRTLRAEISTAFDEASSAGVAADSQRRVSYNSDAQEVVISRIDPDTGSVVNQFPDDAILRQRAYVRQATSEALESGRASKNQTFA